MQKKVIRLTESDLHRIIKESVNNILREAKLNEMHPLTYASARDKQIQRNNDYDNLKPLSKKPKGYDNHRAERFNQAAVDTYNDKYNEFGLSNGKPYAHNIMDYDGTVDDDFMEHDGKTIRIKHYNDNEGNYDTHILNNDGSQTKIDSGNEISHNYEPLNVARQMKLGNGKYVKGKGWE